MTIVCVKHCRSEEPVTTDDVAHAAMLEADPQIAFYLHALTSLGCEIFWSPEGPLWDVVHDELGWETVRNSTEMAIVYRAWKRLHDTLAALGAMKGK